jgi:hypothetical protein
MQYYAQRYMTQINDLFATIPSSLLLLLKTNDCLRQLDKSVGRPVNTLTGLSVCLSVCLSVSSLLSPLAIFTMI